MARKLRPGDVLLERFEVIEPLGKGGMGAVYAVRDRQRDDRQLALKVLSHDTPDSLRRFRREFASVSRLEHPSIVEMDGFWELDGGAAGFTMELVSGASLDLAAGAPWRSLVPIYCQVLEALAYIHGRRVVHRDIKPANMMLCGWGPDRPLEGTRAKLTDFGIVKELGRQTTQITQDGGVVGTILYMAPEQALSAPVDGRADLYALGVMLYEAVTGRGPYREEDGSGLELLLAKQQCEVVDPCVHVPVLSSGLRDLLLALLNRDRSGRPASALAVRRELEQLARQPDAAPRRAAGGRVAQDATIRAAWLQEGPMFVLPTLHGRDPELQQLGELLQPGSQEQPVLWLEGPAGVGKSALINAWASRLRRGDALVLTSQCEGAGDDAMQLLERLLSRAQDPAGRAGTTAPARVAALAGDAHLEYREHIKAAFDLLCELAAPRRLVLVVEDLQRLDPSQADLLLRLATYLLLEREGQGAHAEAARGARVLLCSRPLVGDGPARELLTSLGDLRAVRSMSLAPLGDEAAWSLALELCGGAPGGAAARPEGVAPVVQKAGGIPAALINLIRAAMDTAPAHESGSGRPEVGLMVEAELRRIDPGALGLMQHAAVLGVRFCLRHLVAFSGAAEEDCLSVLDGALRLGLLVEEDNFRFAQAYVPEVLLEGLSGAHHKVMHRQAAEAMRQDAGRDAGVAMAVAEHYLASDAPQEAVPFLVTAAREALARRSHHEAARAFEAAQKRGGEAVVDAAFAEEYGDALTGHGAPEAGLAQYERALALLADAGGEPFTRARVGLKASRTAGRMMQMDRAATFVRGAMKALGHEPPGKASAMWSMFWSLAGLNRRVQRLERVLDGGWHPSPAAPSGEVDLLLSECITQYSVVEMYRARDLLPVLALSTRALDLLLQGGESQIGPHLAERLGVQATILLYLPGRQDGRQLLALARRIARHFPGHPAAMNARAQAVAGRFADGDLLGTIEEAEEVLPQVDHGGGTLAEWMLLSALCEANSILGRFDESARIQDVLRRSAAHLQDSNLRFTAEMEQVFVETYVNPGPHIVEPYEELIRRADEAQERAITTILRAMRPVVLHRAAGLEQALAAIPEAEELLDNEQVTGTAQLARAHLGGILTEAAWSGHGHDPRAVSGFLSRAARHIKKLKKHARYAPLLTCFHLMIEADLAWARGRGEEGDAFMDRARQDRLGQQSPYMSWYMDARQAIWALRRGEEGQQAALEELAARARERGWEGDARIIVESIQACLEAQD